VFQALIEEYQALRDEISETSKQQFQLATAVDVVSVVGFAGAVTVLRDQAWPLFLIALVAASQLLLFVELNTRVIALGSRLRGLERQLQDAAGDRSVMQWQSGYVSRLFDALPQPPQQAAGCLLCRKSRAAWAWGTWLLMRAARLAPVFPLVGVYVACVLALLARCCGTWQPWAWALICIAVLCVWSVWASVQQTTGQVADAAKVARSLAERPQPDKRSQC
jgi:hypothetical protein